MKRLTCAFAISFLAIAAFAQAKDDSIRALIALTGSDTLAVQMMDLMIPQLQELIPEVPDDLWQQFRTQVRTDTFIELIIPIYRNHYAESEIQELIAFYKTPLGQKLIKESPAVMQESYDAGQQWGEDIVNELFKMLEEKGYQVPSG